MKPILVLILGMPVAAALSVATSLPLVAALAAVMLWALWLEAGSQQHA